MGPVQEWERAKGADTFSSEEEIWTSSDLFCISANCDLGVWRLVSCAERKYVASLVSPRSLLKATAFCGGQRVAAHRG
ncbi:hypothetical protein AV530_014989 [Patagioenas fasciata monilis]|uniref:Uncharacterized protein n=1 Tax=Patagioenas fasciata monilis TaxID=372326 RepID=A0A1V4K245_PATFA|nr:hypothetical protein AV530_014989 [Patagioenas fasciata monilis]